MRNIDFDDLTEAHLQRMVEDAVPESRQLEYKLALWADTGDGHREYVRDLSSFANAQGGDLLVGMAEVGSIASNLFGIEVANLPKLQEALENRHRNRIEPPITGIRMRCVDLANGRQALVIRVPSSLSGPHRDRQDGHFFVRGETRKDQMGIHELRDAFVGSDQLIDRLRRLHAAAVDVMHRPELPFVISADPAAVISVMPLDVLRARRDLDLAYGNAVSAHWPGAAGRTWDLILEGLVLRVASDPVCSFALSHRQGRVDAFWTIGSKRPDHGQDDVLLVSLEKFEIGLRDIVKATQVQLGQHGVVGPWIIMTSLVGIAGARLPMSLATLETNPPVPRQTASLPDVIGEQIDEVFLLPVFKAFSRVFGRERPRA